MKIPAFSLTILPLENGDHLRRDEFEQRYAKMSQVKKAELIEGIVYMASPVRISQHGEPHALIISWLMVYKTYTPQVQLGDNCTVRLDADNELQPDALLRIEINGQSTISEDDYVEGAPELVVEIAASKASIDLHEKLQVYRRNQVQEYIVWRVYDRQLDWFQLKNNQYTTLEADKNQIIHSEIYPGLWLDTKALLSGNYSQVLTVLQQGMNTSKHENFVKNLNSK